MKCQIIERIKNFLKNFLSSDIDYEFEEFLDPANADFYQKQKLLQRLSTKETKSKDNK